MTSSITPLAVQLCAPGLDVSHLTTGLEQASIHVVEFVAGTDSPSENPLLVVYTDPLGLCQQDQIDRAVSSVLELGDALAKVISESQCCRLSNLACLSVPDVVAWCVEPASPATFRFPHPFPRPDPLIAMMALELLRHHPSLADTYLALEAHELAALYDQRPIDSDFENRYRDACCWQSLLDARAQHNFLCEELSLLAQQVDPMRFNHQQNLDLQDQIQSLRRQIDQAEVLARHCSDLEITLQVQQQELEVLSRRLALLESLLGNACESAAVVQLKLSQILSC